MVSSKQILRETGIKSMKTLTRWHKDRIIPEPTIGPSSSGRGKLAYWPDWVLDRCKQIVDLQRQGHGLHAAVALIEGKRVNDAINKAIHVGELASEIEHKEIAGVSLGDAFLSLVTEHLTQVAAADVIHVAIAQLRAVGILRRSLVLLNAGFNPVLLIMGTEVRIFPDFLVSHELSDGAASAQPCITLPLLAPLQRLFSAIGRELPTPKFYRPAPKLWRERGDVDFEVMFYPGGMNGFEIIPGSETRIGQASEPEK
jgi:hypothetical protein